MKLYKKTGLFQGRFLKTDWNGMKEFKSESFSLLKAVENDFHKIPADAQPRVKSILSSDNIKLADLEYLNSFVVWT